MARSAQEGNLRVQNQAGWHTPWDSAFTGIQNASEKPPISKSQGETGQAAKNMIKTRMDLSTVLVPVFMSTRNTLLTHLLAKHNQDAKNIPHVDWHF